MALTIDWPSIDRVAQVQRFIDVNWRRGHILARDADFLRWQFRHPDDNLVSVMVADFNGEIVGILGVIQTSVDLGGIVGTGAWLANWVIAKEGAPPGVGLQLLHGVLSRDFALVGTLGCNAHALRLFGSLRFMTVPSVPRVARGFCREALQSLLYDKRGDDEDGRGAWLDTCAGMPARPPDSRLAVVDFDDAAGQDWDDALRQIVEPRFVGARRTREFLVWRYVRHPRFHYSIRVVRDRNAKRISGLAVSRIAEIRDRSERVLRIVELLGDDDSLAELAFDLSALAQREQVAFADFYCTASRPCQALQKLGFLKEQDVGAPLPSLFQPLSFDRTALTGAFYVAPKIASETSGFLADHVLYATRADCDQDRPN